MRKAQPLPGSDSTSTLSLRAAQIRCPMARPRPVPARLVEKNGGIREGLKAYGPMDVGYYYANKVLNLYDQYGS